MIYITGDTHGEFSRIEQFCERIKPTRDDTIIILGDAGINYYGGWRDIHKKQCLAKLPITLFCIHGNHEMRPEKLPCYHTTEWSGGQVYVEDQYLPEFYQKQLAKKKTFIFSVDALSEVSPTLDQYDSDLGNTAFAMIEPPSIDQRIVNQYSFFSVIPNGITDIEALLAKVRVESVRYIIRKEIRWDVRDMLDQFNVNDRIIYPGLDGICKWLGRHYFVRGNRD